MRSEQPDDRPFSVSFVCTGNRARSPLAAALFRLRSGGARVITDSFGTLEAGSRPALEEAVRAGRIVGVDISEHRSRTISRARLADADLVLGFEPFHVACSIVDGGAAPGRTFTLPELVALLDELTLPEPLTGLERARIGVKAAARLRAGAPRATAPSLADPYSKPQEVFDRLARELDALTTSLATRLFTPGSAVAP